jgi:hypothetical protein
LFVENEGKSVVNRFIFYILCIAAVYVLLRNALPARVILLFLLLIISRAALVVLVMRRKKKPAVPSQGKGQERQQ